MRIQIKKQNITSILHPGLLLEKRLGLMRITWTYLGTGSPLARTSSLLSPTPVSPCKNPAARGGGDEGTPWFGQKILLNPQTLRHPDWPGQKHLDYRDTCNHTLPCQQAVCYSLEALLLPGPFMAMICLYLLLILTHHLGEVKYLSNEIL